MSFASTPRTTQVVDVLHFESHLSSLPFTLRTCCLPTWLLVMLRGVYILLHNQHEMLHHHGIIYTYSVTYRPTNLISAFMLFQANSCQIWGKSLSDGSHAVALYNNVSPSDHCLVCV